MATVNARIDSKSKEKVQGILAELGLNMSSAIEIFFRQIILTKGIPFDIRLPNRVTTNAVAELEAGGGKKFNTVDELFEDLDN